MSDQPVLQSGVLIIGHGTRDARGLDEFRQVVALAEARFSDRWVRAAFLELAEPTILSGMAQLAEQGVRRIDVLPLLLFSAGHAKRDIPALLTEARASYPHIEIVQHDVLECHPALVTLSAQRYREACPFGDFSPGEPTTLVLVGRGSLDDDATRAMHRFAELRCLATPVAACHVGFVAMVEPKLAVVLERAAQGEPRRIVVQPHLLFAGQLLDDIARAVAEIAQRTPHKQWWIAPRLGVHSALVDVLADRLNHGA